MHPTVQLILAFRKTAARLRQGARYRWSHHALCNCGNLAQVVTDLGPDAIYEAAFQKPGDWGEQARDHCPTSGLPMDRIIGQILALGLEPTDIQHLERLTHPKVLRRVPAERRPLKHTSREDTALFMETWAAMLEEGLDELRLAELRRREAEDAAEAPGGAAASEDGAADASAPDEAAPGDLDADARVA
ncbi:MAG TPA: hypothetical protein RMH85_07430 [Polyangiaceae bacterium LLY-WYZ-15_(1-7)]|nr:hypothetical protein [Polyangiaceae bacterium LLY-WYZ-15_(1-7)]HJL04064.1 hypothetical protein [Polyangiaceae bacterium LLY-WYZ-15_(1-7)]HJL08311.1 hypothetical protein [Polyangiaceae bacterium LLY-WYZ-15_(1-7)]HJL21427.1 hypothetical protein [Polyangiaceae bacterium LLY-WYZ-15_(1-7)]HJL31956.1 hypothetical protein [Polyangiaceae bacterium LLY-WYZ-15_(1-7)]